MRKLTQINRHSEPGFYASALPGAPRFLVLPEGRDGPAAVQLDHSAQRRAFTLIKLTSQSIGMGYRADELSIIANLHDGVLEPRECPIGALVVSDNAVSFQLIGENGVLMLVGITEGIDDGKSGRVLAKTPVRWEIPDGSDEGAPALFQSHPRRVEAKLTEVSQPTP